MNALSAEALRNGLTGYWSLERVFEGHGASLRGTASLLPAAPGALAYEESGQLALPDGRVLQAYRRYLYRICDRALEIDFDDGPDNGSLFVRLAFADGSAEGAEASAVHYCGDDVYRVRFRLALPGAFESDIAVCGPNKAYRAISRYTKRRSSAASTTAFA